jgi:hypothetical protein
MDELPRPQGGSGWSVAKVIGVIVGLLGMAGFGLCTLCGLIFVGSEPDVFIWMLAGAVMTFLFGWLVVAMFRKAREERDRDNP